MERGIELTEKNYPASTSLRKRESRVRNLRPHITAK